MAASSKTLEVRRKRLRSILPILKKTYPDAKCSLNYANPFQLLVATILSAQCTDVRVNLVTPALFKKYKTPADLAAAPQEEVEEMIRSTGFYRNKATSIRAMAKDVAEKYGGKVPRTMEELTALHGVGRKTANVVLGNAFGLSEGVVVDTHIGRLSKRLELTKQTDAVKIEQDLVAVVPREEWTIFAHLLIHHGRAICQARKPKCGECPIREHCPSASV